jgi:hypothetical protein
MTQKNSVNTILGLALAVIMAAIAGSAQADEGRIAELEARVVQLETLVQALLDAPRQAGAPAAALAGTPGETATGQRDNAKTPSPSSGAAPAQAEHRFAFGGYIKADMIYSDFGGGQVAGKSSGRDFYIPATVPTGEGGESYLDLHAKESRINFKSNHTLASGARLGTMLELDFLTGDQGDDRVSNSYSPRLRHAFLTYGRWLFGQTWVTFLNVGALPENLDFIGPAESTIFGRQVQVRYTNGPWAVSLENPETTITPYGGGDRIMADDSHLPDLVGRYTVERDWGHFAVAAIARELRCDHAAGCVRDSTSSFGISLSGKLLLGERDDLRWMISTGKGLGRYIGLNAANGAVLDADGKLHAIDSTGIFGSYRHFWTEAWRSNLTLGYLQVDNPIELTGTDVTRTAGSVHLNLIYSPLPMLDFGVEFLYALREIESGADGDLKRLQFSAKYAY